MKVFKSLLCVALLSLTIYSCAPEDLPDNSPAKAQNKTMDTGDQADEFIDRKHNESEAQNKTMDTGDQADEFIDRKHNESEAQSKTMDTGDQADEFIDRKHNESSKKRN